MLLVIFVSPGENQAETLPNASLKSYHYTSLFGSTNARTHGDNKGKEIRYLFLVALCRR
jgi:hypothetical protein